MAYRKVGGRKSAKRKTGSRVGTVKHRRRRRVSGTGDIMGIVEQAAGITLGAIAGRESAALIGQALPGQMANPLITGLVQVAAGIYLAKTQKGFVQNIAYGLIANGGVTAVVATNIISGTNDRMAYNINGTANLPVVNGTSNLPVINGGTRIANNVRGQIGGTRIQNQIMPIRSAVQTAPRFSHWT